MPAARRRLERAARTVRTAADRGEDVGSIVHATGDVLTALVSFARDSGDFTAAMRYARELLTLDPGNAQLRALVADLERKARP